MAISDLKVELTVDTTMLDAAIKDFARKMDASLAESMAESMAEAFRPMAEKMREASAAVTRMGDVVRLKVPRQYETRILGAGRPEDAMTQDEFNRRAKVPDTCRCRYDPANRVTTLNPDCPDHGRAARGLAPEFGAVQIADVDLARAGSVALAALEVGRRSNDRTWMRAAAAARREEIAATQGSSTRQSQTCTCSIAGDGDAKTMTLRLDCRAHGWLARRLVAAAPPRGPTWTYGPGAWVDPGVPPAVRGLERPDPEPTVAPWKRPARKIEVEEG